MIKSRNWQSLVESDELGLRNAYMKAILNLAMIQASEVVDQYEERGEEVPPDLRPGFDDPEEIINLVQEKQPPPWWPSVLSRILIQITCQHEDETRENIRPHPLDPNQKDMGMNSFISVTKTLLESQGEPFVGHIKIRILSKTDRSFLGGFSGEVYIGKSDRKGKGSRGSRHEEELFEYVSEEMKRSHDAMQQMFGSASSVIHASGSAINAMKGHQAQWGEEENADPMWMTILNGAMQVAAGSGLFDGNPNPAGAVNAAGQIMQHPVRGPGAITQQHQHQIPGPVQHSAGYQGTPGQYDGYSVHEDDILDDSFEDDEYEEDEFEYEDDEYEYEEDDEYEENSRRKSGNPLDGMSPQELQKHLDRYIDENQDKKAELKKLGFQVAKKLM